MSDPIIADLKPRDYRAPQVGIADNIKKFIEQSPDSFECLLYRADITGQEVVTAEVDTVGSLESIERDITYQPPVKCRALAIPDDAPKEVDIEGEAQALTGVDPSVFILTEVNVPDQSVIQYREYINATEIRDIALYVVYSGWVGLAPGVHPKHYCLPMQDFEDLKP